MRLSEGIAAAYFVYLAAAAIALHLPRSRASTVILSGAGSISLIACLPRLSGWRAAMIARDWLPGIYILAGYWLSGLLYTRPALRVENRLVHLDRRLFHDAGIPAFIAGAPRIVLEYLELAYLCCYLVVPAGFATLYLAGFAEQADRYWTIVLMAVYACYGMLPWIPTRPPRTTEGDAGMDERRLAIRRVNQIVLQHGSIHVNTFPSGHSAGALASALALANALPVAALAFGVIAASITVASVFGRYHYTADAILGVLAAILAWLLITGT